MCTCHLYIYNVRMYACKYNNIGLFKYYLKFYLSIHVGQNGSSLASHADKLKWKLLTQFSIFFSKFINTPLSSVCNHGDNSVTKACSLQSAAERSSDDGCSRRQRVSECVERCFVSGCQLLCLLAQVPLSRSSSADNKGTYIHCTCS